MRTTFFKINLQFFSLINSFLLISIKMVAIVFFEGVARDHFLTGRVDLIRTRVIKSTCNKANGDCYYFLAAFAAFAALVALGGLDDLGFLGPSTLMSVREGDFLMPPLAYT